MLSWLLFILFMSPVYSKLIKIESPIENNIKVKLNNVPGPEIIKKAGEHDSNNNQDDDKAMDEKYRENDKSQACLKGQSLFSKNDLEDLITHISLIEQNVIDSINETYYFSAIAVRDQYIDDLTEFLQRFEERPGHLKHIMADIIEVRKTIEPLANDVAVKLKSLDIYEDYYIEKLNNTETILEKFDTWKQLCQLNCDHPIDRQDIIETDEVNKIVLKNVKNHCAYLKDIYGTITTRLLEFRDEFSNYIFEKIDSDRLGFEEKIESLKMNLKDNAVKKFGLTMYEILYLQDEYYHLWDNLNKNDVSEDLLSLKKVMYQIDIKTMELESNVEQYRKSCISCSSKKYSNVNTPFYEDGWSIHGEEEEVDEEEEIVSSETVTASDTSILDDLIDSHIGEIKKIITSSYTDLFQELNDMLDYEDMIGINLAKLEPIQEEVTKDIINEIEQFNQLKRLVPEFSFRKISDLSKKSKELLYLLEDTVAFTNQFTK